MKTSLVLILSSALCGCQTIESGVASLPSVQHCQSVQYSRDYGHVRITMDCAIPPQPSAGIALPLAP